MNKVVKSLYTFSAQKAYKFFAARRRSINARSLVNNYISNNSYRKLHLGCGGNTLPGWLNSDLMPYHSAIARIDASKPFPIADSSFNAVYSEHLFEHLDIKGQLNYLSECRRILMPGGKIRIATPDFNFLIALTKENLTDVEKHHLQFNRQHFLNNVPSQLLENNSAVYVVNNYMRDWGHQLIHNRASLVDLISYSGFSEISFQQVGESKEPAFVNIERHYEMIGVDLNNLETMIIEASKPIV